MAVLQPTMSAKSEQKPRDTTKSPSNTTAKPAKEVLLVAQDVKFARALADNDKKLRDRAVKRLKKWFQQRYTAHPFTDDDFMRIWKGLFYSMWMSDKPLVQEECAENITRLVHFPDADTSLSFFKCGFQTLVQEWFGIDQLRLDKFLMFARRLLRQGFIVLKNTGWKKEIVNKFGEVLMESVLKPKADNVLGLKMHFTDIYLEELAKVSEGRIAPTRITQLISPFVKHLALLDDFREINHIKKHVFHYLIRQSDKGIEFEERFEAWRQSGFAGGSINSVVKQYIPPEERIPEPEEEETATESKDKPLDPRAGRVNVDLPPLKFNCEDIVKMLEEYKFIEGSSPKSRKTIKTIINEFSELSKGKYPLDVKKLHVPKDKDDNYSTKLKHSVNRLVKFEKKLLEKEKKPKKRKSETTLNDTEAPKKKKKRRTVSDEGDIDMFAQKLQDFMNNSEHKVKRSKKLAKLMEEDVDLSECATIFRRNSGTWYVTDENPEEKPSISSPTVSEPNNFEEEDFVKEEENNCFVDVEESSEDDSGEEEEFDYDDYYQQLLDADRKSWEEEEEELYLTPREKKVKEVNKKLEKELVENPFSKPQTPVNSTKKVKIALNFNQSQEFHEHELQVLNSPAIPFDSNKKPIKPLLKPSPVSSPINPFYRKKKLFGTSF